MLSRIIHSFIFLLITMLLAACGAEDGGSDDSSGNGSTTQTLSTLDELKSSVRSMDLSGAQAFVITGSATTGRKPAVVYKSAQLANRTPIDMDPNSLYKVNSDGTLERVAVKDDNDTEVDRGLVSPFGLYDVDANYLFMWFSIKENIVPYLVHKKTGLAYNGEGVIWNDTAACSTDNSCQTINKQNRKVRSDVNGNIYLHSYFTETPTIVKIDTSNLGDTSITAQAVQSQYSVSSTSWDIDDSGSTLLFRGTDSSNSIVKIYVDLTDGSLTRVEQIMTTVTSGYDTMEDIFRGLDGQLYVVGFNSSNLNSVEPSDTNRRLFAASRDSVGNLALTDRGNLGSNTPFLWGNHHRQVINGRLIYINGNISADGSTYMGSIFEFDHVSGQFTEHLIPASQFKNGSDSIKRFTVSNGYIYFFGTDKTTSVDTVYRYNPATQSGILFPTDISSPINDFDIGNIRVLNSNKVWFKAFRFSDSAIVIGELDMDSSTIEIVDTIDASEPIIITLEAIHPADFIVVDGSYQDWHIDLRTTSDASNDGSSGHELTFLSHQQTASQFFALIEFNDDNIASPNAATIITIDSMYEVVIRTEEAFIRKLSDDSETTFLTAGAIAAIGQAVEFSVPLGALMGTGSLPTVTVTRFSLNDISAVDTYNSVNKKHTFTVNLSRVLNASDTFIVMLEHFEVEITSTKVILIDTVNSTNMDLTADTTGLDTISIEILIDDIDIDSPDTALTLVVQDQLPITEDSM
ncbi:MAG: hypothetical protein ACI9FD_004553 [Gammaproteobacteria bacterium]|jgi:hypothetical protein